MREWGTGPGLGVFLSILGSWTDGLKTGKAASVSLISLICQMSWLARVGSPQEMDFRCSRRGLGEASLPFWLGVRGGAQGGKWGLRGSKETGRGSAPRVNLAVYLT